MRMRAACPEISECLLEGLQGGLSAISLPSIIALNSAFCNDADPELIYAQSVMALGREGDILFAISTSGNAKNVYAACLVAKARGLTVIALTGEGEGRLRDISDICIRADESETFKVQELHLPIYHYICAKVEKRFFDYKNFNETRKTGGFRPYSL